MERQTQVCQNRTINYGYDNLYRLTSETVTDAASELGGNYAVQYTFDQAGNRIRKIKDAITTTYTYNGRDQLLSEQTGTGPAQTHSYDPNGALTSTSDSSRGVAILCGVRRLVETRLYATEADYTAGTYAQAVHYHYDDLGNRDEVVIRDGSDVTIRTESYTYDAQGRLTIDSQPEGTIQYAYNDLGQHVRTWTDHNDTVPRAGAERGGETLRVGRAGTVVEAGGGP